MGVQWTVNDYEIVEIVWDMQLFFSSKISRTQTELWKLPLINEFGSALADAH